MFLQEKKKLSYAVGKMMCGITDAVGNFVLEVGAIRTQTAPTPHTADATPSSSGLRRSKRRRSTAHEEPQEDEASAYAETEDELGDDDEETELEDEEEDEDGQEKKMRHPREMMKMRKMEKKRKRDQPRNQAQSVARWRIRMLVVAGLHCTPYQRVARKMQGILTGTGPTALHTGTIMTQLTTHH
jgi:hypothetical protein